MSEIATLNGGVGAVTVINENFVPEYLLIGNAEDDLPLTAFTVTISGQEVMNIQGQALVQAFSKYKMQGLLGANVKVSQLLRIGTGGVGNTQFQARLTNAGLTTPAIYARSSKRSDGRLLGGSNIQIDASSFQTFQNFLALFLDPTNVESADITFQDGWSDKFDVAELESEFAVDNPADAGGLLGTILCIDNEKFLMENMVGIEQIRINATSGGSISVFVAGIN